MNLRELNKIAMVVLGSLLLFFGTKAVVDEIFEEHPIEKPGYEVPIAAKEPEAVPEKAEAEPAVPLANLLAEANVQEGEAVAKKCAVCHTFEKGGANKIGPNLYGVVGRKIASHEGFAYSPALQGKEGDWDYANLDHFLEKPQGFAPGTKMAFAGIPSAQQRADVLAYLRTLSDNPLPLPEPEAAAEAKPEVVPEASKEAEAKPGTEPALPADEEMKPGTEPEPSEEAELTPKTEAEGQVEAVAPPPAAEAREAEGAPAESFGALLKAADVAKGQSVAKKCAACHTFEEGGPNKIGPNLHDVVGRKIASHEGFAYSEALKSKNSDWTYDKLDRFLADPKGFAPGTTMVFPGVKNDAQRADLIAYLRSLNPNPPPLPGP